MRLFLFDNVLNSLSLLVKEFVQMKSHSERVVICLLFNLSIQSIRKNLAFCELFILNCTLYCMWNGPIDNEILFATFFGLVIPPFSIINLEMAIRMLYSVSNIKYNELIHAIRSVLFLLVVQLAAYIIKNKNLKRKNFHFFAFLLLYSSFENYFQVMLFVLWLSMVTVRNRLIPVYFKDILHKDSPDDGFNHIFIIGSLTYSYYYLNQKDYRKLLISIGILDAFASIAGDILNSKKRTLTGVITGQLASWIVEYMIYGTVDFEYHAILGFVEYISPCIDNITIGFVSTVYQLFRYKSKTNVNI